MQFISLFLVIYTIAVVFVNGEDWTRLFFPPFSPFPPSQLSILSLLHVILYFSPPLNQLRLFSSLGNLSLPLFVVSTVFLLLTQQLTMIRSFEREKKEEVWYEPLVPPRWRRKYLTIVITWSRRCYNQDSRFLNFQEVITLQTPIISSFSADG